MFGRGGALGYGGLSGITVALDTFKNGNDPSGNFAGIGDGATDAPKYDVITWANMKAFAAERPRPVVPPMMTIDLPWRGSALTRGSSGRTGACFQDETRRRATPAASNPQRAVIVGSGTA